MLAAGPAPRAATEGSGRAALTTLAAVLVAIVIALLAAPRAQADTQIMRWGTFDVEGGLFTQLTPQAVSLEEVKTIDAGNATSYILERNGTVWAFGYGAEGQLGDGGTGSSPETPVRVDFPEGVRIVAIGEAKDDGFAIDSSGQAWSWGLGEEGSLCRRSRHILTPEPIPGLTGAVAVQGGQNHVLWLMANGTVEGCGTNEEGELGLGEAVTEVHTPTVIPGLEHIAQVSAGFGLSVVRDSAGRVFAFGSNSHGQIGIGSTASNVFRPAQVPLPGPASEVSAGGDDPGNAHALAIVEGVTYGWGSDDSGEVGDGSRANKASPVEIPMRFSHVVASGQSSIGLEDGDVWTVGSAAGGALGSGLGRGLQLSWTMVDTGRSMISGTAQNSLDG